jgi:hypothetical protein
MSLDFQKYLRFIAPGAFIYALCSLFCWTTHWCTLAFPASYEELTKTVLTLIFGTLYLLTSLREFSNGPFHSRVNINITELLCRPFRQTIPEASQLPWKRVRIIFYGFIDADPSLTIQSSIIRFNGFFWTSIADLRVIAYAGIAAFSIVPIVALLVPTLDFQDSHLAISWAILWAIALGSFPVSYILTERHRRLGEAQCDVIIANYKKELGEKLLAAVQAAK